MSEPNRRTHRRRGEATLMERVSESPPQEQRVSRESRRSIVAEGARHRDAAI